MSQRTLENEKPSENALKGSSLWTSWRDNFTASFSMAENLGRKAAQQREALIHSPSASKWESLFSRVAENSTVSITNTIQ